MTTPIETAVVTAATVAADATVAVVAGAMGVTNTFTNPVFVITGLIDGTEQRVLTLPLSTVEEESIALFCKMVGMPVDSFTEDLKITEGAKTWDILGLKIKTKGVKVTLKGTAAVMEQSAALLIPEAEFHIG